MEVGGQWLEPKQGLYFLCTGPSAKPLPKALGPLEMKPGIIAAALSALWSCHPSPMEFHKLNIVDRRFTDRPPRSLNVLEYYVVVNPPSSIDALAKSALAFSRAQPVAYPSQRFWIDRSFMRESKATPRTFVETNERQGSIKFHGEDNLLGIAHVRTDVRDCWFVHIPTRDTPSALDTCTDLAPTAPTQGSIPETP
jgi:hypothetical protein